MLNYLLTDPKFAGIRHAIVAGGILYILQIAGAIQSIDFGSWTPLIAAILGGAVGQLKATYSTYGV